MYSPLELGLFAGILSDNEDDVVIQKTLSCNCIAALYFLYLFLLSQSPDCDHEGPKRENL